jgi:hypothetical protein
MTPNPQTPNANNVPEFEANLGVTRLPTCEFCLDRSEFYGDTARGARKAYMCGRHFKQHGAGMGDGRGFRLVMMLGFTQSA